MESQSGPSGSCFDAGKRQSDDRSHQNSRGGKRGRQETMAPKGHLTRQARLHPFSSLGWRRRYPRPSQRQGLFPKDQQENEVERFALRAFQKEFRRSDFIS